MRFGLSVRSAALGVAIIAVTAVAGRSDVARADPSASDPPAGGLAADAAFTSFAVGGWIFTEVAKPSIGPTACRWCDRDLNGVDTLNGFDAAVRSAFRWQNPHAADITSSVFGFGVAPAGAIAGLVAAAVQDHHGNQAFEDMLLVAEATSFAMDVNQVAKFAAARARPDIHDNPFVSGISPDERLSFFSGHATFTFAIAASSGTVASMRGYRLAPMIWVGGMAVAATTAYLRVAADKHYATDVLVGALVGTAMGAGVPLLLHRGRRRFAITSAFDAHGGTLGLAGVF